MKEFESLNIADIPTKNIDCVELAHLAVNLAYKTDCVSRYTLEALMTDGNQLVGSNWEILAASCDKVSTCKYGYKAVAFINKATKTIHIASAGTKANAYDIYDDVLITCHYAPSKLAVVKEFVEEIIEKIGGIAEAKKYVFNTSGHSLGAISADLTGVELYSRNLNFNKSVTFDSPGSGEVIEYAIEQDLFTGKVTAGAREFAEHSEVYNAKHNIINTTNNHLGKVNLVLSKVDTLETSEPLKTGGWGSYLYSMVGSIAYQVSEYLGINNMIEGISNHKLKNFANLADKVILPMDDWQEKILNNNKDTQKLKNISSSGYDVFLLDTTRVVIEDTSIIAVDKYQWAYHDLQTCAKEVESIGNMNNNCIEALC